MSKGIPGRKEFEDMAARGRLHGSERDSLIPSDVDLEGGRSPLDLDRLYGYTEDDIACYYYSRRHGSTAAYTEYAWDLERAKVAHGPRSARQSM